MIFSGKNAGARIDICADIRLDARPLALLCCLAASLAASGAPHMPLLPRPQHIVYGEGKLILQGL
jgi:hypothetical protein